MSVFQALRIHRLPLPAGCAHIVNSVLCFESEFLLSLLGRSIADCDVAGSSRTENMVDRMTACLLKSGNGFLNGCALSGTEVEDADGIICLSEERDRFNMAFSKIADMDVVTQARSVRCVVIIAENGEALERTARNL